MQYEMFLAHMLFGMTLMTFALAFAHTLADGIAAKMGGGKSAARIRALLTIGTTSTILLTFVAFSVDRRLDLEKILPSRWRPHGEAFAGAPLRVVSAPATTDQAGRFEESVSLFEPGVGAAVSGLGDVNGLDVLALPAAGLDDPFCAAWFEALQARTIAQGLPGRPSLLLVCTRVKGTAEETKLALGYAEAGAPSLFIGPTPSADDELLAKAFPGMQWIRYNAFASNGPLVLGGAALAYGEMPSGLSVHLGDDWHKQDGNLITGQGYATPLTATFQPHSEMPPATALLWLREGPAMGRRVWTSLPPRLYGGLALAYGAYWRHLGERTLAFLTASPFAGLTASRSAAGTPWVAITPGPELPSRDDGHEQRASEPRYQSVAQAPEAARAEWLLDTAQIPTDAVLRSLGAFRDPILFSTRSWDRLAPSAWARQASEVLSQSFAARGMPESDPEGAWRAIVVPVRSSGADGLGDEVERIHRFLHAPLVHLTVAQVADTAAPDGFVATPIGELLEWRAAKAKALIRSMRRDGRTTIIEVSNRSDEPMRDFVLSVSEADSWDIHDDSGVQVGSSRTEEELSGGLAHVPIAVLAPHATLSLSLSRRP